MSTIGENGKPKRVKTGGRKKGTPNKVTSLLKDDILLAAEKAHSGGRVGYLKEQAQTNPVAFMGLLGRVLPTQVNEVPKSDTVPFDGFRIETI